ncbi:MAG: RNA polymerase sigma factor, partial [Pirellulales bacterium]
MPNFPTTAWNLLDSINQSAETSPESKNRFITGYWKPVFAYFRAKGVSHEQAEDYTQEFFARLFEKEWLKTFNLSRGRFRTFLLTIVQRFLSDNSSNRMPKQKKFESGFVPISCLIAESDFSFDAVDHQTPETVFMRQLARSVVQATKDQLHLW